MQTTQSERHLLKIGSFAFFVGIIIAVTSTLIHPSTQDPSNHPLVFTAYASNDSWIAIHIGQLVGVIMVFVAGFATLFRLLAQSESNKVSTLAWTGLVLAIMTASAFAVLQAVDGIALKMAVDSWVTAASDEKAITFRVAEGIRFLEYGTNSIFRILQGIVAVIFGISIVKSKILSKWIGGIGVVIGAVTIYAGIEVTFLGFGGLTTRIGVSMILYFVWVGIMGVLMLKRSMEKSI